MANTEKIQALIAKIRESLQITPYATMETVNGSGTVEGTACNITTTAGE